MFLNLTPFCWLSAAQHRDQACLAHGGFTPGLVQAWHSPSPRGGGEGELSHHGQPGEGWAWLCDWWAGPGQESLRAVSQLLCGEHMGSQTALPLCQHSVPSQRRWACFLQPCPAAMSVRLALTHEAHASPARGTTSVWQARWLGPQASHAGWAGDDRELRAQPLEANMMTDVPSMDQAKKCWPPS